MLFDTNTNFGKKVARRLRDEQVIWLTTVAADGTPQPNPVWFLWDGKMFLIYTRTKAKKIVNIKKHPQVALHFDARQSGEDVVIFSGLAEFDQSTPLAHENESYIEKYRAGIAALGLTPEQMGNDYNVRIRIRPVKVRGW